MAPFDPNRREDARLVTRNQVPQPFMGRREWILVLMISFALAVVVFGFAPESCSSGPEETPGAPFQATEMPYPDLSGMAPMPSFAEIDHFADRIAEYLERPDRIFGQPMPIMIGWAREQLQRDMLQPPIPMRIAASELLQASGDPQYYIRNGARVAMSGTIIEQHPLTIMPDTPAAIEDHNESEPDGPDESMEEEQGEQWQRLLIEAAPNVYFHALVRDQAAELNLGKEVNLVGRYLGLMSAPVIQRTEENEGESPAAQTVMMPTIAAWQGSEITSPAQRDVSSLLRLGVDERPGTGPFRIDTSVFADVDDNSLRLERRPYYYLLGLVLRDRTTPGVYDDVQDGVEMEQQLHHSADDYRGHPFTVRGQVLRAWEDWDVSRDHPYGVQRVFRIWLWAYVPERRTVMVDGEERIITASQLGVFEVAAVVSSDAELPEVNDTVEASGRFLKIQRYRRSRDFVFNRGSLRDSDRALSDSVYFKFIVADGFRSSPPREEMSILVLKVGFLVIFTSLLIFVVRLIDRDRARLDDYKKPLRRLRSARRALRKAAREEAAAAAEAGEQTAYRTAEADDSALEDDSDDDAEHDGDQPRP